MTSTGELCSQWKEQVENPTEGEPSAITQLRAEQHQTIDSAVREERDVRSEAHDGLAEKESALAHIPTLTRPPRQTKPSVKESGHFDSSDGYIPTEENFPGGAYKYIFYGQDGTIIMSLSIDKEHVDLIGKPFDSATDDAGRLDLTWAMSENQINQRVTAFQNLAVSKGQKIDSAGYREQLKAKCGTTSIEVQPDYGSTTLGYRPNPTTRSQFMIRLGQLFPNTNIFESKQELQDA